MIKSKHCCERSDNLLLSAVPIYHLLKQMRVNLLGDFLHGTCHSGCYYKDYYPDSLLDFIYECPNFKRVAATRLPDRAPALQWHQNGRDGVSNHQRRDCLLNRLFRRRSKKIPKLRLIGLCAGNSPLTGEFPAQRASNAENVSIWWGHHGMMGPTMSARWYAPLWEMEVKAWHLSFRRVLAVYLILLRFIYHLLKTVTPTASQVQYEACIQGNLHVDLLSR